MVEFKLSKTQRYDMAVVIATIMCLLFLATRYILTGRFGQFYLLWNMVLAASPYVIARVSSYMCNSNNKKSVKIVIVVVSYTCWLLLYPNAPYIFTDFIHVVSKAWLGDIQMQWLSEYHLLWFDVILNGAFAFAWHFIGLVSMGIIIDLLKCVFIRSVSWLLIAFATFISGFAIYIGRFSRLNSWDLLFHPVLVVRVFIKAISEPFPILFSLSASFFIAMSFALFYLIIRNENSKK